MTSVRVGQVLEAQRAFTAEEVRAFAELTGDTGRHHVVSDDRGRLMVHGLLTASIGTRIGGSIDYLARSMTFSFKRPVWTGELIVCRLVITAVEERADRLVVAMSGACTNPAGEVVLEAQSDGVVRR